jgi:hypothetical protein
MTTRGDSLRRGWLIRAVRTQHVMTCTDDQRINRLDPPYAKLKAPKVSHGMVVRNIQGVVAELYRPTLMRTLLSSLVDFVVEHPDRRNANCQGLPLDG